MSIMGLNNCRGVPRVDVQHRAQNSQEISEKTPLELSINYDFLSGSTDRRKGISTLAGGVGKRS